MSLPYHLKTATKLPRRLLLRRRDFLNTEYMVKVKVLSITGHEGPEGE